jgi:hypothetical protein
MAKYFKLTTTITCMLHLALRGQLFPQIIQPRPLKLLRYHYSPSFTNVWFCTCKEYIFQFSSFLKPAYFGISSINIYHDTRESLNRSQMNIKRKTSHIWTWGKKSVDISSTNIDKHVPLLYQCAEAFFDCCLRHFRNPVSIYSSSVKRLPPTFEPLYATNTCHRKQKTFLYEYTLHWVLLPTTNAQKNATLR